MNRKERREKKLPKMTEVIDRSGRVDWSLQNTEKAMDELGRLIKFCQEGSVYEDLAIGLVTVHAAMIEAMSNQDFESLNAIRALSEEIILYRVAQNKRREAEKNGQVQKESPKKDI
jgi:hypothetical protein